MYNEKWIEMFPSSEAWFMLEGLFDHSPMLLKVHKEVTRSRCPFMYYIMWSSAPDFQSRVKRAWEINVWGSAMYCTVQRLKQVKHEMKMLNKEGFCDIQVEDAKAYDELLACQKKLQDSNDIENGEKERKAAAAYRKIHAQYISFLSQKAIMAWVTSRDENTAFFHRAIKIRKLHNTMYGIHVMNGDRKEGKGVEDAFVQYNKQLVGTARESRRCLNDDIIAIGPVLSQKQQDSLMVPVSEEDIQNALFSIPGDKSPGPDGFGTFFYKDAWHIMGPDII